MIQDTINPIMVRLILTTGILLLFTWGASAEHEGMQTFGQVRSAEVTSQAAEIVGQQGMIGAGTRLMNKQPFEVVLADGR